MSNWKLLLKQKRKLKELNEEFSERFNNAPWVGHMGTPHIMDTSAGRAAYNRHVRYEDGLRRLNERIKEQEAKIKRTENRIIRRNSQTKQSKKFLEKNPIHPALIELSQSGELNQWKRNPEYFFVPGVRKVAFKTIDGKIMISARYPLLKTHSENEVEIVRSVFNKLKEKSKGEEE